MPSLSDQILQAIQGLSEEDQRQVLNFAEFLISKRQQAVAEESKAAPQSFFEAAKDVIGTVEGPSDLATNPAYMEGYGQ
ncbi:MAG: DUF2281 domain-containing protein [Phormidesmis sp.]